MSIFKHRTKFGPIVLGIWLIATGVMQVAHLAFPYSGPILAGLAITAGVLIMLDR